MRARHKQTDATSTSSKEEDDTTTCTVRSRTIKLINMLSSKHRMRTRYSLWTARRVWTGVRPFNWLQVEPVGWGEGTLQCGSAALTLLTSTMFCERCLQLSRQGINTPPAPLYVEPVRFKQSRRSAIVWSTLKHKLN